MFEVSKYNPPGVIYQVIEGENSTKRERHVAENGICDLKKLDRGRYKILDDVVSRNARILSCTSTYRLRWNYSKFKIRTGIFYKPLIFVLTDGYCVFEKLRNQRCLAHKT